MGLVCVFHTGDKVGGRNLLGYRASLCLSAFAGTKKIQLHLLRFFRFFNALDPAALRRRGGMALNFGFFMRQIWNHERDKMISEEIMLRGHWERREGMGTFTYYKHSHPHQSRENSFFHIARVYVVW